MKPEASPTLPPEPTKIPDATDLPEPRVYLTLLGTGAITFTLHKIDLGQGIMTSLVTIVAEELDVDPHRIDIEAAPIHIRLDKLRTVGSDSTSEGYNRLRQAAAEARARLVTAADWVCQVSSDSCIHPTDDMRFSLPELLLATVEMAWPKSRMKDSSVYIYIGKPFGRREMPQIASGARSLPIT